MKRITLRVEGKIGSKDLLLLAVTAPPVDGLTVGDIRRRVKLADIIDAIPIDAEHFDIETADWVSLKDIFETTRFTTTKRLIVQVADDLEKAPEAP